MIYYVCKDKDGNLYTQGAQGFRPKEAINTIDKSLIGKKIKLIEINKTDLDGNPVVDAEGKPLKEKVAVVDEVAQAAYEAEQAAAAQAELLKQQERDALVVKLKDSKSKVKAMKLEELTLVVEDILNYLGL